MANKPAPKPDLTRPSDAFHVIASASGMAADTDLRTVTKMPKHAPQTVTFIGTTAAADIVFLQEDLQKGTDISKTVSVPANAVIVLTRPIKTIVKSGSGAVQILCEWWVGDSAEWNP
jgi:hypothetical protein